MQLVADGEPLDRRDLVPGGHHRRRQAGQHTRPSPHTARAPHGALVTAPLAAGEIGVLALRIQETDPRLRFDDVLSPVDLERHRNARCADHGALGSDKSHGPASRTADWSRRASRRPAGVRIRESRVALPGLPAGDLVRKPTPLALSDQMPPRRKAALSGSRCARAHGRGSDMVGSDRRFRAVRLVQRVLVDPPVRLVWRVGLAPPGDAELETTGRQTGKPHRTRICNGTVGSTFWLIAQHGHRTDYVRNIEADPRVRVRTGPHRGWRTGVAHILDDDDPHERRRRLAEGDGWRWMCLSASHAMSTDPLTIRIDLHSDDSSTGTDRRAARRRVRAPVPADDAP
jgi:deazaflavin-dependent oxidoreductase (nitroreductase family)